MSVDQIKKFLESATDYPDSTPITIGETQIPLGSLRQLNASERTQISERMAATEKKEAELDTRQASILDLSQKAQQAYEAAETARRIATTQQPSNTTDPFADPWLSPVKSALEARDKKIDELTGLIKGLQGTVGQAATVWAQDRWDREYNSLNFGKRDKKPTREEILKFSQDNKILDSYGMPSISRAWEKMSEADRMEQMRQEAIEKGREEGRMEAMAARVTQPGVSGIGQGPQPNARRITADTDILGDLYAEAIKDPDLRAQIESLGGGLA